MATKSHAMPESDEEAQDRAEKIFGVRPCLWQIKAARAILEGKDVLTIAPTGAGKSFAYWLVLAFIKEGTILVVTPLKELGAQFESELKSKGFQALNVTAKNATDEIYKDIAKLKYRVVVFGPETMVKDHRFDDLLKNREFMRNLVNFVFDEAHVIQDWGGTFRPEYQKLGPFRFTMARHIPYHLGTATLPLLAAQSLSEHLHLGEDTENIRLDTDRKNIFYRVERMKHPLKSYRDLAALVSPGPETPESKKFLVSFNSRNAAQEGAEFLRAHLPDYQIDMLNWVHSGMTDEFRHEEVHALKISARLGACATDAVGMGIDIRDIYMVIQYGAPDSLSTWYQRLGRAVRDLMLNGCAILLAEPSHFDDVKKAAAEKAKEAAERARKAEEAAEAAKAEVREIQRASTSAVATSGMVKLTKRKSDEMSGGLRRKRKVKATDPEQPSAPKNLDFDGFPIRIERAMDDFINAENRPGRKCRREIGRVHFGNVGLKPVVDHHCCTRAGCSPRPVAHCCDLCEPNYWPFTTDLVFEGKKQTRMSNPKQYDRGEKEKQLWKILDAERNQWAAGKLGTYSMLTPQAIWPNVLMDRIVDWAHENKLTNMEEFRKRISWAYTEEMGPKIITLIADNYKYEKPPPKPRAPKSTSTVPTAPKSPEVPSSAHIASISHSLLPFPTTPAQGPSRTPLLNSMLHPSSFFATPTPNTVVAGPSRVPTSPSPSISSTPTPTRKNAPSTCSNCGRIGHRKTSRMCPKHPSTTVKENTTVRNSSGGSSSLLS